jgi:replicative DNA helicase
MPRHSEALPATEDPEIGVLGALVLDPNALDEVSDIIRPEHFLQAGNGKVYAAVRDLIIRQGRIDGIILAQELLRRGILEECGGALYVGQIIEAVPHSSHARYYAEIVRERADLQAITILTEQAGKAARSGQKSSADVCEILEAGLLELSHDDCRGGDLRIGATMQDTLDEIQRRITAGSAVTGLSSGFRDLDKKTTGFHGAELIILAARPSMGKTAFVGCVAANMAASGQTVLFISLEQRTCQIQERLIARVANVPHHFIRTGSLDSNDFEKVREASETINGWPLHIDDRSGLTMAEIRTVARRILRKHGLSIVIVDYLQLVRPEDRRAPREQQVADISRQLKSLAKELNVPVIALAQLNRGVETREDKQPRLADLRESGSIEQDADVVMFLHRPEKYDVEDRRGLAELHIEKQRSGETGIVNLTWRGAFMSFENFPEVPSMDYRFGGHLR